jgi:hypothetical protein
MSISAGLIAARYPPGNRRSPSAGRCSRAGACPRPRRTSRRHHLAARDARHVRDDRLDLGDAVVAEELLDITRHESPVWTCAARAVPRRAEGREQRARKRLLITCHSGCHCTASAKRRRVAHAKGLDEAVIGARASTARPAPSSRTPCACSEFTWMRRRPPGARARRPASAHLMRRRVLHIERLVLSSRWSQVPGTPARAATACRRRRRSFPGSRGRRRAPARRRRPPRDQRQRRRVALGDHAACRGARLAAVAMRLDVRGAAREHQPSSCASSASSFELLAQHRDQQRQRARRLSSGMDVLLAHRVERMRPEHAPVGRNADDGGV